MNIATELGGHAEFFQLFEQTLPAQAEGLRGFQLVAAGGEESLLNHLPL